MEYIYASLLLHQAKKEINEKSVSRVLDAAGIEADSAKTKALVASLKDVNIEEAIQKAVVMPAAVPVQAGGEAEKKKEDKKSEEEDAKAEMSAAEGLGSLFG